MSFLKRVFSNISTVGAISPSSSFLYKKMISSIQLDKDIHIVEFWAGSGAFTDKILKKLTPKSRLSIFEIDSYFVEKLQLKYQNDARVIIYPIGAEESKQFFKKASVDYILSSLPLGIIDKPIVSNILESSKFILKKKGHFIQFQYFLQNKKQINETFPSVRYLFTFLNLPPAFVYVCKK